jgi:hypothetical protein
MVCEPVLNHGVMEGNGAYNKHAKLPATGAALATPFLEKAVREVRLDPMGSPVTVADYGSSQGKNSLAPMRIAIENLRARLGPDRPISVFHIDQPSNDFNTLFEVLGADPDRYALGDPNVFPCAIGRSFYESVLPPDSVHLGWSSYAAMWLSRVPTRMSRHFIPFRGTDTERAAFHQQGARDWEAFLTLRAAELRAGGRLIVVLAAKYALFFRSIFVPSLSLGLRQAREPEERRIFADRFENGLKRRLLNQAAPLSSFVQTMVLAKRDSQ